MSTSTINHPSSKVNDPPHQLLPSLSPTSPFGDSLDTFTVGVKKDDTGSSSLYSDVEDLGISPAAGSSSSPPTFLDHPPSPSVLPPPYATNNPFTKSSKHSRPTPLGYVPPPTPLVSRRSKAIVLSPLLPSHGRIRRPSAVAHKFHATRPRQSSYTPTSRTSFSSFSPRNPSFSAANGPQTPGSPYAVFPPTPSYLRRTSMTPSQTPTILTIFNEPPISPPRSASITSEYGISLGGFETLPQAYQPQPSPPTSPNPSPITYAFPPLSHHSIRGSRRTSRSSSLDRGSAPASPARTRKTGPTSPGSAPRKAKAFLGVPQSPGGPLGGAGGGKKRSPAEVEQAKRDRERRKKAEAARPLPYAKKVEIDESFGETPRKPKKTALVSSSRSKSGASAEAKSKWDGSANSRNVGGGHSIEHMGDDGTLWMDVEEEQEFTWLLSEIGRGGQPLPHWPIHFSSHLHASISPTGANFPPGVMSLPTFLEQEEPEQDKEAWTVPVTVSVLDMPKRDKIRSPTPGSDSDSEESTVSELGVLGKPISSSKKEKKRPKPLQLPSTLSSSLPKSFTLSPARAQEEGKSEFMSSTFRPASPPTKSTTTTKEPQSLAYTIPEPKRADSGGPTFGSLGKGAGGKAGRLVKGWFGSKK